MFMRPTSYFSKLKKVHRLLTVVKLLRLKCSCHNHLHLRCLAGCWAMAVADLIT